MKTKTLFLVASFMALLCCKNETDDRKNNPLQFSSKKLDSSKDTSKLEKITAVKNNEYFLFNDKKRDQ